MTPSEWTRSVRAVRDTPVADYSVPGVKTTHRVTDRPPIAVSPFLLALSVSYFKQTLWCCGQMWPYVGMGSLHTRLHRDCNAMGDAAKICPRIPSTLSSTSVGRWEDMILPGREDPRNCVYLVQSEWDQKVGQIEREFSLYDKRRWKWDDVYLLRGLPNIYSPSLCPPPLPLCLRTTAAAPWRCTWSSELRDILRGRDRASLEMHLEAVIERIWRYTWRQWSSELRDALRDPDRASLEMDLESVIERVWRYTWRPWSSEFGDVLAGNDRARLEEDLQAVDLAGGATAAETLFIGLLVIVGM